MKYSSLYLMKRLFNEYTRPKLPELFLAMFFMVIFGIANSSQMIIIKEVYQKIFQQQSIHYKYILPVKIVILYIILGLSNYASNVTMSSTGFSIVNDMQKKLFQHIIRSDLSFHYKKNSGELISRISNDLAVIRAAIVDVVVLVFKQGVTTIGVIGVMFYQNWELSLVAFSVLIFIVYPVMRVAKRLRKLARQWQQQMADLTNKMNESFGGIRTVKAYQGEEFEIARISSLMDKTLKNKIKSIRIGNINGPLLSILSGLALAVVIWYVGSTADKATHGDVIAFAVGLLMLLRPAKSVGNLSNSMQNSLVAAERYFSLLDWQREIIDKTDAKILEVVGGEIKIEDVSFKYDVLESEPVYALKSLSLTVPAGKRVALVGPSGSGKSTVMNLLLRFFEPEHGSIRVDEQNINDVTILSLRNNISLVTQEVFLFDDTIAANIAYGLDNVDPRAIEAAAIAAAADEFIKKTPLGYETIVGEDGIRLSGGQKQRISIARALLRNTKILLLDEATSSLDTVSEREFQNALESLMQGKTTLMIAHRLSTVINADLIYVMDQGRVVDSGTHEELLKNSPTYRQLFHS